MSKSNYHQAIILNAAICALLALTIIMASAHKAASKPTIPQAAVGSPALRLVQSYRLGVADYAASAAVQALDEKIKAGKSTIPQMMLDAEQARIGERGGYQAAQEELRLMGAPNVVVAPYPPAVAVLSSPVIISDNAKSQFPGDQPAQQVWSTIDEAERIAPPDDGTMTSWLKLSRGRDALWAYHVGNLAAVIRAGLPDDPSRFPLVHGAGALAESAPEGCPKALVNGLMHINDQANENKVTHYSLAALDTTIQDVFGPGPTVLARRDQPARL